jgi:hypothetical protein
MFSVSEKRWLACQIESLILGLKHPEMPTDKPMFKLHVDGKEGWSFADIEPNHIFDDGKPVKVNPFNEVSRELHKGLV